MTDLQHLRALLEAATPGQVFGPKVDRHCPYDEATLRIDRELPGREICPCCWTSFDAPSEQSQ